MAVTEWQVKAMFTEEAREVLAKPPDDPYAQLCGTLAKGGSLSLFFFFSFCSWLDTIC
jgi:hypothetical protein